MTFQDEDGDFQIKELLLLDESQNPEWAHLKDLLWVELFKALDELPENQRLVFIENEMEEKTLKQIADEQSVTRERVRQVEYKAIEKMVRFYSDITY